MTIDEQERAAYMAGDTKTAELLARIDALQRALGQAMADMEELTDERNALRDELHDLREVLQ
jgi:predicted  nucleic acid-binding Zn-ribbon protein